jgi:hypothetical protein
MYFETLLCSMNHLRIEWFVLLFLRWSILTYYEQCTVIFFRWTFFLLLDGNTQLSNLDSAIVNVAYKSTRERIEYLSTLPLETRCVVYHVKVTPLDEIRVVCEFSDVFLDDLPGMPHIKMLTLLLTFYLSLLLFLSVRIYCLVINYLSSRSGLRSYWKKDSFVLVHHLGGH